MVYTAFDGIISKNGWLIFWLVLFTILTIFGIILAYLYFKSSQNKTRKATISIILFNILVIAFELQLIFIKTNINF